MLAVPVAYAERSSDRPVVIPLESGADALGAFASERAPAGLSIAPPIAQVVHAFGMTSIAAPALELPGHTPSRVRVRVHLPGWLGTGSVAIVAGALGGLVIAAALGPREVPRAAAIELLPARAVASGPAAIALAAAACAPTAVSAAEFHAVSPVPRDAEAPRPRPALPVPQPRPAPTVTGTVAVASPFPVRVLVDGEDIGTSDSARLTAPAGSRTVTLVNDVLEYSEVRTLEIGARRLTRVAVEPLTGVLHLNAQPWAQVWIDGRRAGDTPLGNLSLPVGDHEVVMRHPDLGEQRRTVTVGARTPVHVGVEFSR